MSTAAETTAPTTEPATPTPPGPPRRRSRRTREAPGARGSTPLRMIAGAIVAIVFLLPYLVMLVGSFKSRPEILRIPPTYLPEEWLPEYYVFMLSAPETPLPANLSSTLVIAGCSTLLTLAVATPAAYYTARF